MEIIFSSEQIRHILQNAGEIKRDARCIHCDGTGYENWNEDGEDIRPGKTHSARRTWAECEACDGIGFMLDF